MKREVNIETPSDTTVVVTRNFDATARMMFDAWTKCEHLKKWMLGPGGWEMTECNPYGEPGKKWHLTWDRKDGSQPMTLHGVSKVFDPPQRLVATENWGGPWPETVNDLEFQESDGLTTVILTITYPSKQARDAAMQTGMREGMEMSYARLDILFEEMAGR